MNQNNFLSVHTPTNIVIYQSVHSSGLVGFLTIVLKFFHPKFEVWVSYAALCDVFA